MNPKQIKRVIHNFILMTIKHTFQKGLYEKDMIIKMVVAYCIERETDFLTDGI